MGLMTLLTRKINPDKQPQVRAPTYERKASTKSPVRLVQTVSPNSTISRSHSSPEVPKPNSRDIKARRYSSSPLSQASFSIDSAAPAPVVLGFRGDETPSRPNASTHKLEADAQRMEILPGPSAALPRPSLWLSQLMTPRSRASLILTPEPAATATARAQQRSHRSQSSISSSKLAKSIRSVNGKGHVDLLDAQSEFKPLDFHSRVKAAGTRDYGEDVADRNIGVNGCNLDSQPVQAYYAVRPRTSIRATALDQRRPFSAWNRRPDFSDDEDDTMCYTHVVKQSSIESALWSNSINSSHPAFYGNEQSQSVLDGAALQKHLALRRQSYNAARAVPPLDAHGTPSLAEIEALHEQQRLLSKKARSHSLQVAAQDANKLVSVWDTTSPESELSSSSARPSTSGSKSRRLHASRKDGAGAGAGLTVFEPNEEAPRFAVNNQPILSPQPTSFRLSASLASSAFTTANMRPSTMHSMHSLQRSQQPSLESHSTMPDLSNLPYHLKETAYNFKEDWHDDHLTDRESAPSPFIKTSRSRSRSRDNTRDFSRVTNVITPRPQSQSGETEDHIPGRTSSARHWSMSSTAPTTSSSSSATYGRPHSRHTASTSIDLSIAGPGSTLGSSLVSTHSDTAKKMQSPKPDAKQPPALRQSPQFNIDDYVSSDDDSFIAGQAERSVSEEDLLFGSGYGKNGMQLPGLEDAFSAPAPIALVRSSRDDFRRTLGEPPLMAKFAPQQMASDESLEVDSSRSRRKRSTGNTEPGLQKRSSREELGSQAQSPARRSETKRMSALLEWTATETIRQHAHHGNGGLGINSLLFHPRPNPHLGHGNNVGEQVIEEEMLEKVDVAAAIRLRKEAKSKKRASVVSTASQTRGRSQVKMVNIEGPKVGNGLSDKTNADASFPAVRIVSEDHEHAVVSDDE